MADIKNYIKYDDPQCNLIDKKLSDSGFSYKNWSDDDLMSLRSFIRNFYRMEQYANCAYCKNPVSVISASNCQVEHIAPKSKYRDFIFEPKNLCVICADCNEIKKEQESLGQPIDPLINGAKRKLYPRSSSAFKIVHPHFDNYDDHIIVLSKAFYLDKSVKGSYTIYACNLNRKLYKFGWEKDIVDETKVIDLMSKFIEEKDSLKRHALLDEFKKLLIQC